MNRKLNGLGLAFVASLAMSAVAATCAQAVELHSAEAHTILNGSQSTTHVFTAGPGFGGVSCTGATFSGTTTATTETEWSMTPLYTNCSDTVGRVAHVKMNGCFYRYHPTGGGGTTYSGHTDLLCPAGKDIEITVTPGGILGQCNVTIQAQNGIAPITFHNGANNAVRADHTAVNLRNETSGGAFNCGISNGLHLEGTYSGDAMWSGTNTGGGLANIFVG